MPFLLEIHSPMLLAFLPHLFRSVDGVMVADFSTITGATICTLLKTRPVRTLPLFTEDNPKQRQFTVSKGLKPLPYGKEYYLTQTDIARINRVLRKEFSAEFTLYWTSYVSAGFTLSDTIEAFIVDYQLDDFFLGDLETLRKRVARFRLDNLRRFKTRLRRNVYYRRRAITTQKSK